MQATLDRMIEPQIDHISGERRSRQRFAMRLELEYKVLGARVPVTGYGTTIDLSSGGIAFEVDADLRPGCQVEVSLQWPVSLPGGIPIKLVVRGTLLRSAGGIAALRVRKCQFRTQKRVRAAGGVEFA